MELINEVMIAQRGASVAIMGSQKSMPYSVRRFYDGEASFLTNGHRSGVLGYVDQETQIRVGNVRLFLTGGMYFRAPSVEVVHGAGILMQKTGFDAQTLIGGPDDGRGRLRWINGVRYSLLVPPMKSGDPCLELISFPRNHFGSLITFAFPFIAVVRDGEGEIQTEDRNYRVEWGNQISIPPNYPHRYVTTPRAPLQLVVFQTVTGESFDDGRNPLVEATIYKGQSAQDVDEIR